MHKIINKPFYNEFLELCAISNNIKLCSPYVKETIVNDIITRKKNGSQLQLLTSVKLNNFHNKSTDVGALKAFIKNDCKVFSNSKLHAKIYIFDDKICAITSANLTESGLKRNIEYGVLSDETTILQSVITDFKCICDDEASGKIELKHLAKIENILKDVVKITSVKFPKIDSIYNKDIFYGDKSSIIGNLSGWDRNLFLILNKLDKQIFSTIDFQLLSGFLLIKYPNNNNIEAKIRQVLQHLRDYGLIEFVERGVYKKLWS